MLRTEHRGSPPAKAKKGWDHKVGGPVPRPDLGTGVPFGGVRALQEALCHFPVKRPEVNKGEESSGTFCAPL